MSISHTVQQFVDHEANEGGDRRENNRPEPFQGPGNRVGGPDEPDAPVAGCGQV